MKAGGPVQAHPLLAPGVGLITTLLALMSAAWILMTLEVAFVVRPLPPRLLWHPLLSHRWCWLHLSSRARRLHARHQG